MTMNRRTGIEPGAGQLAALAVVDRALRREAHVLAGHPDLTWQQLHNRLQWADPPLGTQLAAERERRSRPGGRPWLHRYTPLADPPRSDAPSPGMLPA